jgi:hypothetical protein
MFDFNSISVAKLYLRSITSKQSKFEISFISVKLKKLNYTDKIIHKKVLYIQYFLQFLKNDRKRSI